MVPMAILQLYEGFKESGYTGVREEPAISIALDEYVLKTYPDVQKVALGFENDHIRDQRSHFYFVSQMCKFIIKKVSRSRISMSFDRKLSAVFIFGIVFTIR